MKDTYRSCASVLLYRKHHNVYQLLLLHKPRKSDSWQLPQGGVEDGETYQQAAMRELQEEAGVTGKVLQHGNAVYEYDFPASYRRFRPDHICGQHIEFVIAFLDEGQVVQVDNDEIDDHIWILPEHIPKYILRKEYAEIVEQLAKEAQNVLP